MNPDQRPEPENDPDPGDPALTPNSLEEKREKGLKSEFLVVGVGASAGGLAAFEEFFAGIPADFSTDMAFVLVQHLAPNHHSMLTNLVRRYTKMPVYEVEDGMVIGPNSVYIIPPNRDMALMHGSLHLFEPSAPQGLRLPIDFFFRSLAHDQRDRSIGIVLSGTGTDGSLGLKAIKGEGGIVLVQSLDTAQYDGMPRSAISMNLADYVLPAPEMGAQLMAYAAHTFGRRPIAAIRPVNSIQDSLQKIFILLRDQTGQDFSQYKQNTILRRIERRMAVNQIERLPDYLRYLQRTPAEIGILFQDMLIGVTNFFRDAEAFAALEEQIIPQLFQGEQAPDTLRIWTPACSTGEEAYSIAILLHEYMQKNHRPVKVQMFATDVDRGAIEHARAGIYPENIAADISPERLSLYFTKEDGVFCIKKFIRDMLVFSEQDVVDDPPFSRLDLVSCRNLLIYMNISLQQKVLSIFHYALKQGRFLFLGNSETIGDAGALFASVDRKWKIFRRQGVNPSALAMNNSTMPAHLLAIGSRTGEVGQLKSGFSIQELTERSLLALHVPACVTINTQGEILYVHGRTGRYLEPATGAISVNILHMARPELKIQLTTAIRRAITNTESVFYYAQPVKNNGDIYYVDLSVHVLDTGLPNESKLLLVVFADSRNLEGLLPKAEELWVESSPAALLDRRVQALQQELKAKDEYLQTAVEELETANEELKSANEELQSANEELQSTNEELETSKEELQSVNEEVVTVNAELQKKLEDFSVVNNDMNNLLAGTGIGTLFVDFDLTIQRFTPDTAKVINLIQSDVGRPVSHIVSNLRNYNDLVADLRQVLQSLIPREIQVESTAGRWYLMRIQPYRTQENVIQGAVITFVDITVQRQLEKDLADSALLRRLALVMRDARDAMTVQDFGGQILAWNPAAQRAYGWTEAEALTMNIAKMIPEELAGAWRLYLQNLVAGPIMTPIETQRLTKTGESVLIWLTATVLINDNGLGYAIATTEHKIDR